MTTKKAIEIIKLCIEYCKKRIADVEESKNIIFQESLDHLPRDNPRVVLREIVQNMYETVISVYKEQIEFYERILKELELKTRKRDRKVTTRLQT